MQKLKSFRISKFKVNIFYPIKEQQNCWLLLTVFGRGLGQKSESFRGRLVLLAVISPYLTARSAGAGFFAVGDGRFEFFEPDTGGCVGGGAPIAARGQGPA